MRLKYTKNKADRFYQQTTLRENIFIWITSILPYEIQIRFTKETQPHSVFIFVFVVNMCSLHDWTLYILFLSQER